MKTSELLRQSAAHIERVGLNQDGRSYALPQGRHYDSLSPTDLPTLPCCTMGALSVVAREIAGPTEVPMQVWRAKEYLYEAPEIAPVGSIAEWNDRTTTTQADVVRVMRESADRAEEDGS